MQRQSSAKERGLNFRADIFPTLVLERVKIFLCYNLQNIFSLAIWEQ